MKIIKDNLEESDNKIKELKNNIVNQIQYLHSILNNTYKYMLEIVTDNETIFKNRSINSNNFSFNINLCETATVIEISYIFKDINNFNFIIKELCNNNISNLSNIIRKYKNFNNLIYLCMLYKTQAKNFKIYNTKIVNSIIGNNIVCIIQIIFKYEVFISENQKQDLINLMSLEDAFEIENEFNKNDNIDNTNLY